MIFRNIWNDLASIFAPEITKRQMNLIMKILIASCLLTLVSCAGHLEIPDMGENLNSVEFVHVQATTAVRFPSSDTTSAKEKVSQKWDKDYMMGSGQSTLGCYYEK